MICSNLPLAIYFAYGMCIFQCYSLNLPNPLLSHSIHKSVSHVSISRPALQGISSSVPFFLFHIYMCVCIHIYVYVYLCKYFYISTWDLFISSKNSIFPGQSLCRENEVGSGKSDRAFRPDASLALSGGEWGRRLH